MPALHKTKVRRDLAARRYGKKNKRKLANKGTTTSLPAEGPIPPLRYGQLVKAESIVVPAELLK